ncbi:MAG: hypothetical protein ACT4PU_09210 [Planctomycetota bacterium]
MKARRRRATPEPKNLNGSAGAGVRGGLIALLMLGGLLAAGGWWLLSDREGSTSDPSSASSGASATSAAHFDVEDAAAERPANGQPGLPPDLDSEPTRVAVPLVVAAPATDAAVNGAPGVTGRILDEELRPIAGAEIVVEPREVSADPPEFGFTDASGRFHVEAPRDGELSIALQHPARARVLLENLAVLPNAANALGDIFMPIGPAIGGFVLDAAGRPLADAEVRVVEEDGSFGHDGVHLVEVEMALWEDLQLGPPVTRASELRHAQTDAEGRFLIGGLRLGALHSVYAVVPGLETAVARGVAADAEDLLLSPLPPGRLLLYLVDERTGMRVDDAALRVVRSVQDTAFEDLPVTPLRGGIGPGAYFVHQVCGGALLARVDSASQGRRVLELDGVALEDFLPGGSAWRNIVTVDGTGHTNDPFIERELLVPPGATIAGRITGPFEPVEGVLLTLRWGESPERVRLLDFEPTATSDANGSFRFTGLQAGQWTLSATSRWYVDQSLALKVAPGGRREDVGFQMKPMGRLYVQIRRDDGTPGVGEPVWVEREGPPVSDSRGWKLSDEAGRCELQLAPGAYVVRVLGEARPEVSIAAFAETQVEFRMPALRAPGLLVLKLSAAGHPRPGVRVEANENGESIWATTDDNGECLFTLPPGEHSLTALSPRGGRTSFPPVRVVSGETTTIELSLGSGRVRGRVVDRVTGRGVSGALVKMYGAGSARCFSDADGVFEARDIGGDVHYLQVSHARYADEHASNSSRLRSGELLIRLSPFAAIVGKVSLPDGVSAKTRFSVLLRRIDGDFETMSADVTGGLYVLTGLRDGRYELVAVERDDVGSGFRQAGVEPTAVKLTAGEIRVVDLVAPKP